MMKLRTFKDTKARLPAQRIARLFESVVQEEADPEWSGSINLVFTTDRRIRALNREYRQKDSTTDVLSFNLDAPLKAHSVFGEIYISVPTAIRQARDLGITVSQEYLRLICHGLLHLFGYDHEKSRESLAMKALEDRHINRLREVVPQ